MLKLATHVNYVMDVRSPATSCKRHPIYPSRSVGEWVLGATTIEGKAILFIIQHSEQGHLLHMILCLIIFNQYIQS